MLYIASDHAALELKNILVKFLRTKGHKVKDLGTETKNRVHYTDFAKKLCEKLVRSKDESKGLLICGSGIGMSIMANRFKNIRAAVCINEYMAEMSVRHNNANVLCLGSRVIGDELAKVIIDTFLKSEYEGGRHSIRVEHYDRYHCSV